MKRKTNLEKDHSQSVISKVKIKVKNLITLCKLLNREGVQITSNKKMEKIKITMEPKTEL